MFITSPRRSRSILIFWSEEIKKETYTLDDKDLAQHIAVLIIASCSSFSSLEKPLVYLCLPGWSFEDKNPFSLLRVRL
jgi:hypothetical protein